MRTHLVLLMKTSTGKWWPELYSICGLYYPHQAATREADVDCTRCQKSIASRAAAHGINAKAPEEFQFGPTNRRDLDFCRYD